ncbi:MAG: mechanosensitive ion channel family protein [Sandaracinus sp.]|nr:mechanosensitive ion channel family protein [Sandaracinus sp.]
MNEIVAALKEWSQSIGWSSIARAIVIFLVGLLFARLLSGFLGRVVGARMDAQHRMLLRRAGFYPVVILSGAAGLRELGFDLSVFLGAAGILTVAVGFASQTSASNVISGLFLIGERAFGVGDVIEVGGISGEVLAIDLLSVKVRTFDNLFVRIPNETLVKSNVTNLSRFPLRRIDLVLRFGYGTDLQQVRELLLEIADSEPRVLDEPRPLVFVQEFEATSVRLQFSVWARRELFVDVRTAMQAAVHRRFDEEGVERPMARMMLDAKA